MIGEPWISASLWTSGIYLRDESNWFLFKKKNITRSTWTFFCFEFNFATAKAKMWLNGKKHDMEFEIGTLKNVTKRPNYMKDHLILGKIQPDQSIGYYCQDVVIHFGNFHIYANYPAQNISCQSDGNYLGNYIVSFY